MTQVTWFLEHKGSIYAMNAAGKFVDVLEKPRPVSDLIAFLQKYPSAATIMWRPDAEAAPAKEQTKAEQGVNQPKIIQRPSPKFSSRRGATIDTIVMHYTVTATAAQAIETLTIGERQASAHYVVDRNGDIYQLVQDEFKAWHAPQVNSRSIGIEHVAMPGQQMTDAQSAASAHLVRYLCQKHHIKPEGVTGHKFTGQATACPAALFGPGETEAELRKWVHEHIVEMPAIV